MENKWITLEMYGMYSKGKKEELEKIRKNKLRKTWFQCVDNVISLAKDYLKQEDKEILNEKLNKLIQEVHLTQEEQQKMNKQLVEKGDALLRELKNILQLNF